MRFRLSPCTGGWLLFGALIVSAGCGTGTPQRASVKGKVTLSGKHLTAGSVMFFGKDASTSAPIDKDGNYAMLDAPIGEVQVTVTVPKMSPGAVMMMKRMKTSTALKNTKSVDPETGKSISMAMPTNVVPIPDRYADPSTSGLSYKVEPGEQTHDIPLTP
jgi:hypothetical protein